MDEQRRGEDQAKVSISIEDMVLLETRSSRWGPGRGQNSCVSSAQGGTSNPMESPY